MSTTRIIAEIGSCWYDKNPKTGLLNALSAIDHANIAGADGVKFQLFRADTLYSVKRAPSIYEHIKQYEIPLEWLYKLSNRAFALGLEFGVSVFSEDMADTAVSECKYLNFIKLASGDLTNHSLLKHVCDITSHRRDVELQVSTGAANIAEIYDAIHVIEQYDGNPKFATFFHCVSAYPSKMDEMNLMAVNNYRSKIRGEIGLSDHTKGKQSNIVAQMAVATGYTVFEKHVNLSGIEKSPDDVVASDMNEFKNYINGIRLAEKIAGSSVKRVQKSEESERVWARRGKDGLRPATESE